MLKRLDDADLYLGDCIEVMKTLPDNSVDLTVTSPPYDNLRTYSDTLVWNFDVFKQVAEQLYRVTKRGGVVVWVVGDATVKGSETGTSFKQALYFKEIGFNLHDTMIWEKTARIPTQDRYYNNFEYMFIISKGKPKSMNFIIDHPNVSAGKKRRKDKVINKGENIKSDEYLIYPEFSRRTNVWRIHIGANKETKGHPAVFPEQLANDHIISWSNVGDTVLDPFMGSATTGKMALLNSRKFIGIEKVPEYFNISEQRILQAQETILENILC